MKKKQRDISGNKYNRLTAIKSVFRKPGGHYYWLFKCDCGKEITQAKSNVIRGSIKSCGCLRRERFYKHGMKDTRFYNIWQGIKVRCNHKNRDSEKYYYSKGIKYCERWEKFEYFKTDMYNSYCIHIDKYGEKDTTIDRIDSNLGYYKENCRWETIENQANNKSNNHFLEYKGKKMTISQWAREINIHENTLERRINKSKWSIEKALTTPLRKKI